jgi:transcriptional regulator with XRE-family HTH domain
VSEAFGERLRRLRKLAGYRTQASLNAAMGTSSASHISQLERQWHAPTLNDANQLSRLLGVTLDYLVNGDANQAPNIVCPICASDMGIVRRRTGDKWDDEHTALVGRLRTHAISYELIGKVLGGATAGSIREQCRRTARAAHA